MTTATARVRRTLFRTEEPEWLVWALVILLLAIGIIVRAAVTGRSQELNAGNVSLRYPADWIAMPSEDPAVLGELSEPIESTLFPARVAVQQTPFADLTDNPEATVRDVALQWSTARGNDLTSYKVLTIEPATVTDQEAVKMRYVYVTEPELAGPNSIPIVAEAEDVLVKHGDQLTVLTFTSDADVFDRMQDAWARILASLELK